MLDFYPITFLVLVHVHCRDFNIFSSHGLLPSDLVAQSAERRRSNPKVVGSIPTLVRVFLCPCVGPVPSVGLTLTWFIWDRNLALHVTLHSLQLILFTYQRDAMISGNSILLDARFTNLTNKQTRLHVINLV